MKIIKCIIHQVKVRIDRCRQRLLNLEVGKMPVRSLMPKGNRNGGGKRAAMRVTGIVLFIIGSTQLSACGGGGGAGDSGDTPAIPATFQATAKVANIAVGSLVPGQTTTIGMQAGQTLELDASASSLNWNATSDTITPVVNANTSSSWSATIPASATGLLVLNIVSTQDRTKSATLNVYVAPPSKMSDHGGVEFEGMDSSATQIVALQTTLTVPAQPPASGTVFLWPGLGPQGANYLPIDNGVLQPVLTWGPSCAPGSQPSAYSTWWVSAQYVNTYGRAPGYTGCAGGSIMPVGVGDQLRMSMSLSGTVWIQTVKDIQTGQSVSFSIDMKNQIQNRGYFVIEGYAQQPVGDVVFTDTTITFSPASPLSCVANTQGAANTVSTPLISADGTRCSISEIVLRSGKP